MCQLRSARLDYWDASGFLVIQYSRTPQGLTTQEASFACCNDQGIYGAANGSKTWLKSHLVNSCPNQVT